MAKAKRGIRLSGHPGKLLQHRDFYFETGSWPLSLGKVKVAQSCLTLRPHGLYSPWNSSGHNTEVGSLSLLQGVFPTHGLNPGLLHCRWIILPAEPATREAQLLDGKVKTLSWLIKRHYPVYFWLVK